MSREKMIIHRYYIYKNSRVTVLEKQGICKAQYNTGNTAIY